MHILTGQGSAHRSSALEPGTSLGGESQDITGTAWNAKELKRMVTENTLIALCQEISVNQPQGGAWQAYIDNITRF